MQVGMALSPNSLARRKPGVQIPSPPPHKPAGQSVASLERATLTACWGRAGAANGHGRVFDVGLGAAAGAGRPSGATLRVTGPNHLHSWPLIVLAKGPAPDARGSAG
jgi:hypothetical protein